MREMIAKRMSRIGTETAFEVLAKAKALERQGKEIVHLQIGEPDFDTPENIKEAGIKAIRENKTHYGPSAGLLEARECFAKYISQTRNIPVDPGEVVVTPGGKPILFFSILACIDEGDEVLCPNPAYPIYESMINFVGATAVPIPIKEEKGFIFDIKDFEKRITPMTKMIVLNSPANPTGGVISKEDLEKIANIVVTNDLLVLSDEIYSRIIYEGEHSSIASFPGMKERTIILEGHSKTYAMTGWRLGYGVMNKKIAEKVTKLMTNSNSCTATFTQIAGIEAINGSQNAVDKMVAEFKKRRDVIVEGLNKIPKISCNKPLGAFYVFPNIKETGKKSQELADYLLNEVGVAVLSGTSFGEYGEGYIRLSYATSIENIEKGLEKIEAGLAKL
ncbi:pyridoxal phosphate-dependent aminotransferase [bacterium]|nr:pyridoxal phosphate-dependent aminotransferase [bacterium]